MATYEELSAEDQAVVDNTVNLVRASAGEVARVFNHLIAIANDTNAVGIVASINAGATIPNSSGLAGSDDMTRAEIVSLYNELDTIRSTYDTPTNRAAWSKAAGINEMLG